MSGKQHSQQRNTTNNSNTIERDCTHWCKSKAHANQLISAVTSGVSTDCLKSYFSALCNNFPNVTDSYGRSVLHFAASTGDWRLVEWLIEKCRCDIDLKDLESGWTALHRSFFYGQISVARVLLKHGASGTITDNNNFTPLELQTTDRPVYIEFSKSDPCDCYVWGDNDNFNLGVDSEHSRKTPEIINSFRRDGVSIKQVCIDKFHTVFLANDGRVFSCGTGHGGRLGHDSEELAMTPKLVRGFGGNSSLFCEMIATGEDHTVLLVRSLDNNMPPQVYTCGTNTYHVLGHNTAPIPERLITPKPICLKSLVKTGSNYKMGEIIGVGAGRYHSLFYTKDELFTFGLNVGQLGHQNNASERTIIYPRRVPAKFVQTSDENKKNCLQHVTTSDGAIVVANDKGEVYVIHEYQTRKILSNQYEIEQICCVGGHLNERSDVNGILAYSRVELKIMVLTKTKKIFLWKGSDPNLVQCLLVYGRELSVTHICLNSKIAGFVTKDAEVFFGTVVDRKSKTQPKLSDSSSNKSVKSFVKFVKRDECHIIRVKRQPLIHRAVSLVTDSRNKNFAALVASPKLGMIELAAKPISEMCGNFRLLYETSCVEDSIHDCVIKVGHRQYAVHKYILGSRSSYFSKRFESDFDCEKIEIDTSFVSVESFEQILRFLYYNSNDMFENDKKLLWIKVEESSLNNDSDTKKKDNKKKATKKKNLKQTLKEFEPLQELWESCKKLGVKWLHKWLTGGGVKIIGGNKVKLTHKSPPTPPKLSFNRNLHPELYDIVIKSNDGVEFPCHRCILVARLDYFRGMLGSGFIEASIDSKAITLPINSRILDILMDYMYSDEAPKLMASDDPEFICHVLVVADQFLIPFLKQHCEYNLINLLTLKNSCELLELSYIYNAEQLRRCCLDFICINLLHLIETRAIDVLSDEAMDDLTKQYRQMLAIQRPIPHPFLYDTRRSINRYSCAPNNDEFERIFMSNIIDDEFNVNVEERKAQLKQQKMRIRKLSNSNRQRNESITESTTADASSPQQISPKLSDSRKSIEVDNCQKENIALMKDGVKSDANQSIIATPEPKMLIKWGSISSSTIPPPLSFKDIIAEEESIAAKMKKVLGLHSNSSPITVPKTGRMRATQVLGNRQSPQSLLDNASPKSFAAMTVSPPRSQSNPWKKIDSSVAVTPPSVSMPTFPSIDGTISMRDIVRDEQEKQNNMKRFDAKALDLIAVEDKAIEELLIYYNARDNPYEYITVERVTIDRNRIAAPIWTKRH